uniref:Cystinosin, lysosomal cystine transporter n=1 Tax=Fundulus heteroclitus TaxID=8078 RepID=A0A3Q2P8P5_FUNHE
MECHCFKYVVCFRSSAVNQSTVIQLNVTFSSKNNYSSIITLPQQVTWKKQSDPRLFECSLSVIFLSFFLGNVLSRIRFIVIHSNVLSVVSQVIGWIYFLAWSVSFYPQAWENWRRKSVVGLNFDYLAFNLTGFIAYSVFNIGLFWIPYIKVTLFLRHLIKTFYTYNFFYIMCGVFQALKIGPQFFKSCPHHIVHVFCCVCLSQDEWKLVFGDPTKFGLGLFSVAFDIVFMTQHYCLYRQPQQYEAILEQQDD